MYSYLLLFIENIKTVANLSNKKGIFMCILRFHARADNLQRYETLLKEIYAHPSAGSPDEPACHHYDVERSALADRNVPCESGIRYPSLIVMQNRRFMSSRSITVNY